MLSFKQHSFTALSYQLLFRSRVNVVLLDGPYNSFRKLAATRLSSLLFSTSQALTLAGSLIKAVPAYITTLLSLTAELVHRLLGCHGNRSEPGRTTVLPHLQLLIHLHLGLSHPFSLFCAFLIIVQATTLFL